MLYKRVLSFNTLPLTLLERKSTSSSDRPLATLITAGKPPRISFAHAIGMALSKLRVHAGMILRRIELAWTRQRPLLHDIDIRILTAE